MAPELEEELVDAGITVVEEDPPPPDPPPQADKTNKPKKIMQ